MLDNMDFGALSSGGEAQFHGNRDMRYIFVREDAGIPWKAVWRMYYLEW